MTEATKPEVKILILSKKGSEQKLGLVSDKSTDSIDFTSIQQYIGSNYWLSNKKSEIEQALKEWKLSLGKENQQKNLIELLQFNTTNIEKGVELFLNELDKQIKEEALTLDKSHEDQKAAKERKEDSTLIGGDSEKSTTTSLEQLLKKAWGAKFSKNSQLHDNTGFSINSEKYEVIITLPNVQLATNFELSNVMKEVEKLQKAAELDVIKDYSWKFELNEKYKVIDDNDFKLLLDLSQKKLLTDNAVEKLVIYALQQNEKGNPKPLKQLGQEIITKTINTIGDEEKSNNTTRPRSYSAPAAPILNEYLQCKENLIQDINKDSNLDDETKEKQKSLIERFFNFLFGISDSKTREKIFDHVKNRKDAAGKIAAIEGVMSNKDKNLANIPGYLRERVRYERIRFSHHKDLFETATQYLELEEQIKNPEVEPEKKKRLRKVQEEVWKHYKEISDRYSDRLGTHPTDEGKKKAMLAAQNRALERMNVHKNVLDSITNARVGTVSAVDALKVPTEVEVLGKDIGSR